VPPLLLLLRSPLMTMIMMMIIMIMMAMTSIVIAPNAYAGKCCTTMKDKITAMLLFVKKWGKTEKKFVDKFMK
jgi:hypothetical protein